MVHVTLHERLHPTGLLGGGGFVGGGGGGGGEGGGGGANIQRTCVVVLLVRLASFSTCVVVNVWCWRFAVPVSFGLLWRRTGSPSIRVLLCACIHDLALDIPTKRTPILTFVVASTTQPLTSTHHRVQLFPAVHHQPATAVDCSSW